MSNRLGYQCSVSRSAGHETGTARGDTVKGRCEICDKTVGFGHNVSHSNRKTNRMWRPNVQKAVLLIKGQPTRVAACTRCIRTNRKHTATA